MDQLDSSEIPKREEMVHKQDDIHHQQDGQGTESALQFRPTPQETNILLTHEASWREILAFVEQREQNAPSGKPYRWNRTDAYADERSERLWNTGESF